MELAWGDGWRSSKKGIDGLCGDLTTKPGISLPGYEPGPICELSFKLIELLVLAFELFIL